MPRPTARLTNCYVPLPLPSSGGSASASVIRERLDSLKSSRRGGGGGGGDVDDENQQRDSHSLRRLCIETNVTGGTTLGSSLVELGHTKVLCEVNLSTDYGSLPSSQQQEPQMDTGILQCNVQYTPSIGINIINHLSQTVASLGDNAASSGGKLLHSDIRNKESNIEFYLKSALVPAIQLYKYSKCIIHVNVTILQDDGSILSTCIIASSMALANAKIDLYDLVSSCSVAIISTPTSDDDHMNDDDNDNDHVLYLADPTNYESNLAPQNSSSELCLAMLPNIKEVTLWNINGRVTPTTSNTAMGLCKDGCRTIHKFMREHLISN